MKLFSEIDKRDRQRERKRDRGIFRSGYRQHFDHNNFHCDVLLTLKVCETSQEIPL